MTDENAIREKYLMLKPTMDERAKRYWAATESVAVGYGGVSVLARATGLARNTVANGIAELESEDILDRGRVRKPGGGRKPAKVIDKTLTEDLDRLVDPVTRGDPMSPLRWTCKSTRNLADELTRAGHKVSHPVVAALLDEMGYSLQANRKTREGINHPDRNAQFEHINRRVTRQMSCRQPAISVDAKKKELVGDFKNAGKEWRKKGEPEVVRMHDFMIKDKGKAVPYGIYDLARNSGWVSVGVSKETATFAVNTIRRWWADVGQKEYGKANSLLIVADSGGSNGVRVKLWKWELQKFADHTGLRISVCHMPPGTSKWNKIEHRLFSFITQNWRGKPLLTHAVIVNLIASTKTRTGLKVHCVLDRNQYRSKVKVTEDQIAEIKMKRERFHGDWNYTIIPRCG